MSSYHVVKSTSIRASKDQIIASLSNFKEWPKWSPWLITEPTAQLEFNDQQSKVGAHYAWHGEIVGSGSMELLSISDTQLEMQLEFLKPFKSTARVEFHFRQEDDQCVVSWHMFGHLPFFMFFMKEKMKAWIGMDYERGLTMFKQLIEEGQVSSETIVDGETTIEPQHYVGLKGQCKIDELGNQMQQDFTRLCEYFTEKQWTTEVVPFSIYQTMDMITTETEYIAAIPVSQEVSVEAPFFTNTLHATPGFKVTHTGRYDHLGNAWSIVMQMARFTKHKVRKKPVGIERYLNDPAETPADNLITEVIIPLK